MALRNFSKSALKQRISLFEDCEKHCTASSAVQNLNLSFFQKWNFTNPIFTNVLHVMWLYNSYSLVTLYNTYYCLILISISQ